MKRIKNKTIPLLCWDVCAMNLHETTSRHQDMSMLWTFQQKFDWTIELDSVLKDPYEALVLTDNQQIIQWANQGFQKMTGYPVKYAIGKSPRFLQGQGSSPETKSRIRTKLALRTEFKETIVNYRQNGQEYLCEVRIYPITNTYQELTHFLALEQEIR